MLLGSCVRIHAPSTTRLANRQSPEGIVRRGLLGFGYLLSTILGHLTAHGHSELGLGAVTRPLRRMQWTPFLAAGALRQLIYVDFCPADYVREQSDGGKSAANR
jgi:hypothetical protein